MIGKIVLRHRALIGIILLAITAYAGYETSRVRIGTSFVDFFPRTHPNVELYHEFERYGGAQTLTVMVEVKRGDIFNTNTLQKIQDISFAFDQLPVFAVCKAEPLLLGRGRQLLVRPIDSPP